MSTAKDFKFKAASAFQASKWVEALEQYSQAIALDPEDAFGIANRSAAYLKAGHHAKALQDAQRCQTLEASSSIGYLREATVLYAQQKYQASMAPLQRGLAACDQESRPALERALLGAQRALVLQWPASKAALNMGAALQAAHLRTLDAALTTVAAHNGQKRKAGPLFQAALQNKGRLLGELDNMPNEKDLLDVLFFFVLDSQGRGVVPSQALLQLCQSEENLQLKEALAKIAPDEELNSDAFATTMQQLAADIPSTTTVRQLVEFMIHQTTGQKQQQPQQKEQLDAKETRMLSLFSILDHDGDDTVSFFDMACGIYAWARDHLDPSLQSNTKLLLLMDPKDSRRLDYAQFGKLMLSLSSTWNESLEEVLDDLILAFTMASSDGISDEILQEIIVGGGDGPNSLDALTYTRTKQLFDLLDADGDGSIDFSELLTGFRRYQHASSEAATQTLDGSFKGAANVQAEKIAIMIMGHDEDRNQTLDPEEFAVAMVDYAKAAETDLHQLIDFMCVVVQKKEEDDSFEKAYSEATAFHSKKSSKAFRHNSLLMTISDVEEDCEEEEEED